MRLSFKIEEQVKSHLCWAAVSCSIANFYHNDNVWNQENLVKHIFGEFCNKFYYPAQALKKVGVFHAKLSRSLNFEEIKSEIQAQSIVVARTAWSFGGGHLVTIAGYDENNQIWIEDPKYGSIKSNYNSFKDSYFNFGIWTHTYLTRTPIHWSLVGHEFSVQHHG